MTIKHIYPLNDLREHLLSPHCWCQPTLRQAGGLQPPSLRRADGEARMIHHAADGRPLMDGDWECALADESPSA